MEEGSDAKSQVSGFVLAYVVNIKLHCIMREIGILIIDFSFPEEETSRAQHLSVALYSSSKAEGGGILDM